MATAGDRRSRIRTCVYSVLGLVALTILGISAWLVYALAHAPPFAREFTWPIASLVGTGVGFGYAVFRLRDAISSAAAAALHWCSQVVHRIRFGLRPLLVSVLVFAVACAAFAPKIRAIRRERQLWALADRDDVGVQDMGGAWGVDGFGPQIDDAFLEQLGIINSGSETLYSLQLSKSRITNAGLVHLRRMPGIGRLDLERAPIGDEGMTHIATLSKLEVLDLSYTQVTDAGLAHLQNASSLEYLDLNHTQISDEGLRALKGLSRLKELRLIGTQVTDAGFAHLKSLSSLNELYVASDHVDGSGVQHLKRLPHVGLITLEGNSINDCGLQHIRELRRLHVLGLNNTSVTDDSVECIAFLRLNVIYLGKSKMTPAGIERLRKSVSVDEGYYR